MKSRIYVTNYKEFQRAVAKAVDRDLPKRVGQVHKDIGRFVISRLPAGDPSAVGAGRGAEPRPSATRREVIIRVGGAHRSMKVQQWGKTRVRLFQPAPPRPYILGTAVDHQDTIERMLLDGIAKAMRPAFHDVDKTP